MSPRGVYDRSKSKKGTTVAPAKKAKTATTEKTKRSNLVALPNADVRDQFTILRENIVALTSVRRELQTGGGEAVSYHVERELIAEVDTLTALRQKVFGKTPEEISRETTTTAPTTVISATPAPLPNVKPVLPAPPLPPTA